MDKKVARMAGYLYLALVVVAPVRLIYIQNSIVVPGDGHATAANIIAREPLFRLGMATDILTGLASLFTALLLYRLFRGIDRDLAAVMVILGTFMVTPIYFMNILNDAGALYAAMSPKALAGLDLAQRESLVALFVRLHAYGVTVNEIFWGLWLIPLALLIMKSKLMPRFIGIWLILNGVAYLYQSLTGILSPSLKAATTDYLFPLLLAEVATMAWLAFGKLRVDAAQPAQA